MTYLSSAEFKAQAKSTRSTTARVRKQVAATPEDAGARRIKFSISTDAVDRDNDRVIQAGWQLDNYCKNPVVLWGHDAQQLPVGKCVQIGIENDALCATVEFIQADIPVAGPMAEAVYQLCLKGFLSATSVGFQPIEWEFSDDPARGGDSYNGGADFKRSELMEFSIVNVPANPEALIHETNNQQEEATDDAINASNDEETTPVDEDEPIKSLNTFDYAKDRYALKARLLAL